MTDLIKKCKNCGRDFVVSQWEQEFLRKMDLPAATLCPEERHQRRLSRRNERILYKRNCDLGANAIISLYSPDKDLQVYSQEAWWSDKW
ncbi:hypothetical protein HY605_05110, partial [Candidatus Peregrinibacteria bacterium]|nr:hypothetical protein [Candidatus Peregrinibacteria bacterium]